MRKTKKNEESEDKEIRTNETKIRKSKPRNPYEEIKRTLSKAPTCIASSCTAGIFGFSPSCSPLPLEAAFEATA